MLLIKNSPPGTENWALCFTDVLLLIGLTGIKRRECGEPVGGAAALRTGGLQKFSRFSFFSQSHQRREELKCPEIQRLDLDLDLDLDLGLDLGLEGLSQRQTGTELEDETFL